MACGNSSLPEKHFDSEYILGHELGRGSYSVVRETIHRKTGEKFAVKIIKRAALPPEDEETIIMEVRLLLLCVTLLYL